MEHAERSQRLRYAVCEQRNHVSESKSHAACGKCIAPSFAQGFLNVRDERGVRSLPLQRPLSRGRLAAAPPRRRSAWTRPVYKHRHDQPNIKSIF